MKKNLVVIGYGGMGSWHVGYAQKSDVVNLKGIYDIDPAKNELARSRGIYASTFRFPASDNAKKNCLS